MLVYFLSKANKSGTISVLINYDRYEFLLNLILEIFRMRGNLDLEKRM